MWVRKTNTQGQDVGENTDVLTVEFLFGKELYFWGKWLARPSYLCIFILHEASSKYVVKENCKSKWWGFPVSHSKCKELQVATLS